MKNALKKWYNYVYAVLGDGLITLVILLIYFLVNNEEVFPKRYIAYSYLFAGIVFVGVGFIVQDLYRGHIRHKLNQWDGPLDQSYVDKAWRIFLPLLLGGIASVLVGGILVIVFKA